MKISVWNKQSGKEIPKQLLYCFITYDMNGNMLPISDEYEIRFEDEEKNELKWKLNEANEYIDKLNRENEYLRVHNETLEDKLEMLEDEDV